MTLYKLWKDLEASFEGKGVSVRNKKPNLDALLDQEEHTIHTNKGTVHLFVHTEMFNNQVTPVLTFQTASDLLMSNFTRNKGFVAMQYLSHCIQDEYRRMLDA